jgi:hypothetical protein
MTSPNHHVMEWLWEYGHLQVPKEDLPSLKLNDNEVVDALASIQALDANANRLALAHHGRSINADGDYGPATHDLLTLPRCGEPDHVRFGQAQDPIDAATGGGSWPIPGCNPNDPQRSSRHSVRFHVDRTRATAKQKSYLDKCLLGAQHCCAEAGLQVYLTDGPEAELTISFGPISGNVIGYFYLFQRGNSCSTSLSGKLDINYQPDWYQFCLLIIHEALGHGLGHEHTNGGIMNPSLLRTPANPSTGYPTYKNDGARNNTAWKRMVSWYGGEPVPVPGVDPPTDPIDPTDPTDFYLKGELYLHRSDSGQRVDGPYIIVPKN